MLYKYNKQEQILAVQSTLHIMFQATIFRPIHVISIENILFNFLTNLIDELRDFKLISYLKILRKIFLTEKSENKMFKYRHNPLL